ncbi:hypothetical protein HDU67_009807, partial [Dinochytrium kinnereticum]
MPDLKESNPSSILTKLPLPHLPTRPRRALITILIIACLTLLINLALPPTPTPQDPKAIKKVNDAPNPKRLPPVPLLYLLRSRDEHLDQVVGCDPGDTGDHALGKPVMKRCGKEVGERTYRKHVGNLVKDGPARYESLKKVFDEEMERNVREREIVRGALRKTPKRVGGFDSDAVLIDESHLVAIGRQSAKRGVEVDKRPFRIVRAEEGGIAKGNTTIECAVMDPVVPERFCVTHNLAMRMTLVPKIPVQPLRHRLYDLPPPYGALRGTCELNETWWFHGEMFGNGASRWLY